MNNGKISICCPSYKRGKVDSYAYLKNIKIYVDESEAEEYREKNKGAKIVACKKGIQGNVSRIRNHILNKEFEQGAQAVCLIDDDIQGIYRYEAQENHFGYKRLKLTENEVYDLIEKGTQLCDEFGFRLWGMNCNADARAYRQYTPFSLSSIILGPFCVHLKNEIRYDENLPLKEDYDLAIQHLNKYRGILRFNQCHYLCKQSENVGGCAVMRNRKREKEQFDLLTKKWGTGIIKEDTRINRGSKKVKQFDYNPIIKVPIKGV